MRTEYLCISVLRVESGPSMKLVDCKSALNHLCRLYFISFWVIEPILVILKIEYRFSRR